MSCNVFFQLSLKTSLLITLESTYGPSNAAVKLKVIEMFLFCYCPKDLQEASPWERGSGKKHIRRKLMLQFQEGLPKETCYDRVISE